MRRVEPPVRGVGAGGEPVGDLDVDGCDAADAARREASAHREKTGQRAPIVRDPQRDAGLAERAGHARALGVGPRHRLLDKAGFARGRGQKRQRLVRPRRGRDVDGIDVRIADQFVGGDVDPRDAVPPRVVLGLGPVAPHDGDERRAVSLLEAGAAFDFRDVAAADDAPTDVFHLR